MPDYCFLSTILPRLSKTLVTCWAWMDCPRRRVLSGPLHVKFADDSEMNYLVVQLMKTEDMPIDFRHSHVSPVSAVTDGQVVGRVESCKNRGSTADNELTLLLS